MFTMCVFFARLLRSDQIFFSIANSQFYRSFVSPSRWRKPIVFFVHFVLKKDQNKPKSNCNKNFARWKHILMMTILFPSVIAPSTFPLRHPGVRGEHLPVSLEASPTSPWHEQNAFMCPNAPPEKIKSLHTQIVIAMQNKNKTVNTPSYEMRPACDTGLKPDRWLVQFARPPSRSSMQEEAKGLTPNGLLWVQVNDLEMRRSLF